MTLPWRSLLFTPADDAVRIAKLPGRGMDAVILDLEDAVAPAAKARARSGLARAIAALAAQDIPVVVRVNSGWRDLFADLEAAILPGLAAIMAPKVQSAARLAVIAEMIAETEAARGLAPGAIGLIALIEHPGALPNLAAIADIPRVRGLALGSEDFALALGVPPSPILLRAPCLALAYAAASRQLAAFGTPRSIADYRVPDQLRDAASEARAMGLTGALCIHPAQVLAANIAFQPTPRELAEARAVLEAWTAAEGLGRSVATHDGQMIDQPVVARARAIIARAQAVARAG